jgi:hypothetical protein
MENGPAGYANAAQWGFSTPITKRDLGFLLPFGTTKEMCVTCVLQALCPRGVPMSPNEPSWKMLTALLAVITLSTALFYAGFPPAIAVMPCFLLDMLMRGRLQW